MKNDFTRGEKKIILQFERLVESNSFQDEVRRVRFAIGIPENGLKPTKNDLENLASLERQLLWLPDSFPFPNGHTASVRVSYLRKANIESRKLLDSLTLNNTYFTAVLRNYILFNNFFYEELEKLRQYLDDANVCELVDALAELNEFSPDDPDIPPPVRAYIEMLENHLRKYPVVVRIHPDASQRDIVEFIKKHHFQIKYYQKRYADKTGGASFKHSKTKVNQGRKERDDFIYANRNLPLKELAALLQKEKELDIDQGYLGKIISSMRKRREKM